MYGNLDSIDAAYRTLTGQEPLPPVVPDAGTSVEEKPDGTWLKSDILSWLENEGVDVPAGATKAELLDLVE